MLGWHLYVTGMFECSSLSQWNSRGKWTSSAYPKSRKQRSLTDSAEILMTIVSLCWRVLHQHVFRRFFENDIFICAPTDLRDWMEPVHFKRWLDIQYSTWYMFTICCKELQPGKKNRWIYTHRRHVSKPITMHRHGTAQRRTHSAVESSEHHLDFPPLHSTLTRALMKKGRWNFCHAKYDSE